MAAVGYVVLSHQNPAQVRRLVDRLVRSDPTGQVIIAHDSSQPLELDSYDDHPRVHLLSSSSVRRWGNYGLVSDLLVAVAWALDHLHLGWLAVMSGQDYPLRSLAAFGDQLAGSGCDAFLSARPIPLQRPAASDREGVYAHARYCYRWFRMPDWLLDWAKETPVERLVFGALRRLSGAQPLIFIWWLPRGGGNMIGFRRRKLPFGDELRCYMGSQWLTMSRSAASAVIEFVAQRPDVVRLYRRSIVPDESLPVTVLCNRPEVRVRNSNHHYTRMTGPGNSHAAVLGLADLAELRGSDKYFARKFDPDVDSQILDELDRSVLGEQQASTGLVREPSNTEGRKGAN